MSYDIFVTHCLIAKINRNNNLMIKEDIILNVMRSDIKLYSIPKTYLQM